MRLKHISDGLAVELHDGYAVLRIGVEDAAPHSPPALLWRIETYAGAQALVDAAEIIRGMVEWPALRETWTPAPGPADVPRPPTIHGQDEIHDWSQQ